MPFGLTNTSTTFQNYIHLTLRGLEDDFCIAYLDDILIFSLDRKTYLHYIGKILDRLRNAKLYAKLNKCSFFRDKVEFLSYIVSYNSVTIDTRRVYTITT